MSTSDRFKDLFGRFDVDLGIKHHFSSGCYAKEIHIPAGSMVGQHAHTFDHLSILARGSAVVRTDDWVRTFEAPAVIEIKAGRHHEIAALGDVVWFCIHATEVTDPALIDQELIGG